MSSATSACDPRLTKDSCLECRICWYVYDPNEGDPTEQITPGTPFLELPSHWRCPQCDAEPNAFLPLAKRNE